ncbi:hypothetical protein [Psychrobacter ciconiae]|nr:hypothetical protein [Psychrobacter ciconiae]
MLKKIIALQIAIAMSASVLITGCSTTPEFRPTASVMVGAHKPL